MRDKGNNRRENIFGALGRQKAESMTRRSSRSIPFMTEPEPVYGQPVEVAPGVMRITAQNPSVMTYYGTNSYLVGDEDRLILIDPGPDLDAHVDALVDCAEQVFKRPISHILVSHGHQDHTGAIATLRNRCDAPLYGALIPPMTDMATPDLALTDGLRIGCLTALHTPGHTMDHFCFLREEDGLLFSADHVLTFSSTIVTARHGDMAAYIDSLQLLIDRNDPWLLPGHGPVMHQPRAFYQALLDLRLRREAGVLEALQEGLRTLDELVARIYPHQTHPKSIEAAGYNLISHLRKLVREGRVQQDGPRIWSLPTRPADEVSAGG